jgi:hypothetical protein
MRNNLSCLISLCLGAALATSAPGATLFNNLTPSNSMGIATRPGISSGFEIEAGDDFVLGSQTIINSASFVGVIVPSTGASTAISQVVAEIYRVFPLDSDATRTPNVPTRANSPSDVAFASRDSGASSELSFTTSVLNTNFTALNTVQPGGIHPAPGQTTGGNGPLTGEEVQINVTFTSPFNLQADHFFFVPQVSVTNGEFYWLSASRPISGAGTTPFPAGSTDLQAWTRDANLDPDWLRVGTDIVGGTPAPTFNAAFSLDGTVTPEPGTILGVLGGLAIFGFVRRFRR